MVSILSRSIRSKLVAVVVAAVLAAVAVSTIAGAWREADRRFAAMKTQMSGIAAAFSAGVSDALARGDVRGVTKTLRGVSQVPKIRYVRVLSAEGKPVVQFGSGVIVLRNTDEKRWTGDIGLFEAAYAGTYPVMVPVVHAGRVVGRLDIVADLSELQHALLESLISALLLGVVGSVCGILVAYRLQRSITEPISALTSAIADVQRTHDFARTVEQTSSDETGRLVVAFNDMMREVRERDRALANHRAHLEKQVDERTKDLRFAKVAAERANMAKSEFLAMMSHEIRTPMNGMMVMAEVLAASGLSGRQKRQADVIVKSGQSLLAIINDILDLSKIEAGKMELEAIRFEPAALIDDVVQLFAERAAEKGLTLGGYVDPRVPKALVGDPVRIKQIVANLANNALKFTETGAVTLTAGWRGTGDGGELVIEVSDTGIGIAADKQDVIFDAFAQADQSTTRNYGGTGIGLAICQRLSRAMEGSLSLVSEVGLGSTFTFAAPLQVIETAGTVSRRADGTRPLVWGAMVEADTVRLLRRYLEDSGLAWKDVAADGPVAAVGETPILLLADPEMLDHAAWQDWLGSGVRADVAVGVLGRLGARAADRALRRGLADFVFDFPIRCEDMAAIAEAAFGDVAELRERFASAPGNVADAPASFAGVRVLAADDSAVNREVLREALSRLDVDLTCVSDGRGALEAAKAGRYDLVFMDANMPGMDGFAATSEIRAWERANNLPPVPIVALTAQVIANQLEAWREAGLSDVIFKPFRLQEIEECLATWVVATSDQSGPARVPIGQLEGGTSVAEAKPEVADALLVDWSVLDDIAAMQMPGDDLVGRVVQLYRLHGPAAVEQLRALVGTPDGAVLASAAHALCSLSRNVGAVRVGDLCSALEGRALEGASAFPQEACDEIDRAVQLTVAELDEMSRRSFGGPDPQSEDVGRAPRSPANLSDLGAGEPVAREMRTPFDRRRK